MIIGRRNFLKKMGLAIGSIGAIDNSTKKTTAELDKKLIEANTVPPDKLAQDENFWFTIQQAFNIDRSFINLNYGAVHPSPKIVVDAVKRYMDFANGLPSLNEWHYLRPRKELVRKKVADTFGCSSEEIALLRNTTEAMHNPLLGIDFKPGDELLTTTHDFIAMKNALYQREKREGLRVKTFPFRYPPENLDELANLFESNITPRTRLILVCHITNLTGQIFPIKKICQMARRKGIKVVVDGAHAIGHLEFLQKDLDCDIYGANLHKWIMAPIGTGFLYVKKSEIKNIWPLFPAPDPQDSDIRKFENLGTLPEYLRFAVAEALTFHHGIGVQRKEARLRYLKNYWAQQLNELPEVKILTSFDPKQSCGIGTFTVKNLDMMNLTRALGEKHKIFTFPFEIPSETKNGKSLMGIRVTPSICTTLSELDAFVEAIQHYVKKGLPS